MICNSCGIDDIQGYALISSESYDIINLVINIPPSKENIFYGIAQYFQKERCVHQTGNVNTN